MGKYVIGIVSMVLGLSATAESSLWVEESLFFQKPGSEYIICYGRIKLPSTGLWAISPDSLPEGISESYLSAPKEYSESAKGENVSGKQKDIPKEFSYKILFVMKKEISASPLSLFLKNRDTDDSPEVRWNLPDAVEDEKAVTEMLHTYRKRRWYWYHELSDSPVLGTWSDIYETPSENRLSPPPRTSPANETPDLSAFSVLGGRAAVRETLQMQVLNAGNSPDQEYTVPIESIAGVEVKSHPFTEMLKGKKGGELPLADAVPHDRFFVCFAKPSAMLPFLDDGSDFLSEFGTLATGNSIRYHLKEKYFTRLGLSDEWLRMFLKSGAVKEIGLIFPDMFFIDGTDITVVSRLANPKLTENLLRLTGVKNLSGKEISVTELKNGEKVFRHLKDNLLFISTSESELKASLALMENRGAGSLGQSDEFRYMLTQLPLNSNTRIYAYLSDPFIRNLVSPRTKIAQLRRMKVRAEMEYLTGCALLAKMDGITEPRSMTSLADLGYVSSEKLKQNYTIDKNLIVRSEEYGSLSFLSPLSRITVDSVSQAEADACKTYVENYNRYWRKYFDPIAVRLDEGDDGSLTLTTFILPLIENTVYDSLRAVLKSREEGTALNIPRLSPDPVLMFSLNLSQNAWKDALSGISRILPVHISDSEISDELGPSFHLAIHDADPVISLGSGDILGAFSGNLRWGRGSEMMFIPLALSVLTRPCTMMIETRNPEKIIRLLKQASYPDMRKGNRGFGFRPDTEFYQIGEKDQWICIFGFEGMIKLRFGIEVQDSFILIRNIPWSNQSEIAEIGKSPLNAANLSVYPDSCSLQLSGLNMAALEKNRQAALKGTGLLYPLLASAYALPENAEKKHELLFGFRPVHPGKGRWIWKNGHISSSEYGSVSGQKQPGPDNGNKSGLLREIENFQINMQFEDSGLRTELTWKKK